MKKMICGIPNKDLLMLSGNIAFKKGKKYYGETRYALESEVGKSHTLTHWDKEFTFTVEDVYEDGDFCLSYASNPCIFKSIKDGYTTIHTIIVGDTLFIDSGRIFTPCIQRLLTDSEKQILLDALKKENKIWNEEKKCIEDLQPVFKDGGFVTLDGVWVSIYKGVGKCNNTISDYCGVGLPKSFYNQNLSEATDMRGMNTMKESTDFEIQILINALARDGKQWNAEKKQIENIKPKIGDVVKVDEYMFIYSPQTKSWGTTIANLNNTVVINNTTIKTNVCVHDFGYNITVTNFEERKSFFEILEKFNYVYNSKEVKLIKQFDFSELRQGDFIKFQLKGNTNTIFAVYYSCYLSSIWCFTMTSSVNYNNNMISLKISDIDLSTIEVLNRTL